MMDFVIVPLTTGIVFAAIYALFERFVRRKERMAIIEKIGENFNNSAFDGKLSLPSYGIPRFSFNSLKAGCLLMGVGVGLMVAFFLSLMLAASRREFDFYNEYQVMSTAYGASVLLFGGLGLIVAFVIETNMKKKEDK